MEDRSGAFCKENQIALPGNREGRLAGLTFGVKDIFDIEGARTGFGNPTWLESHPPARSSAPSVQRLLDAGASLRGKTVMDELAYSLSGENIHYGTPKNPRQVDRVPGGSSSGSASAVASNLVDFALGTDCAGSVRLPASYCGIFGIRTSVGSISDEGVIPFSASFDAVGWFSRDSGILARVGDVLLDGESSFPANSRILLVEEAFENLDPRIASGVNAAVERFFSAASWGKVRVPDTSLEEWYNVFQVIQGAEIWANHGDWIEQHKPQFGPGIRERLLRASRTSAEEVAVALGRLDAIRARLDDLLQECDILCLPTSPRIAPSKNSPSNEIEVRFRQQALRLLCIASLGGCPQISLPMLAVEGLPVGLSLVTRRGYDKALLNLVDTMPKFNHSFS